MNRRRLLLIIGLSVSLLACNLADTLLTEVAPEANDVPQQAEPVTIPAQTETAPATANKAPQQEALPPPPEANDGPWTLTTWSEPQAGAFTTSVPTGWLVDGGMGASYGLLHPWIQAVSPDGNIVIRYGYGELALHLLPHPALAQAGYPEGAHVQMDNGATMTVAPYQSGEQAAEAMARIDLQPLCQNLTIDERRSLGTYTRNGAEISEGVVTFHCLIQEQQLVGRYTATTRKILAGQDGAGVWLSDKIAGYAALSTRVQQAEEALSSLTSKLMFNPAWSSGYQEVAEVPGVYFDVADQSDGSTSPFFEDRVADFCIRHGC